MQTKFKRHQKVKILISPDPEYVEYKEDKEVLIKSGMLGEINIILPNGQYHIAIMDEKGKIIAYAPFSEDDLEAVG